MCLVQQTPNTSLHRTPAAAPPSPVSSKPLGDKRKVRACAMVFGVVLVAACEKARTPCTYEVPAGFRGWVLIEFEHPECPALPREHGRLVFRIPSNGVLCTSTAPEFGWAKDEYYFSGPARAAIPSTSWGGGGMVWLETSGTCGSGDKHSAVFQHFFVGTEAEAKNPPPAPEASGCS